MVVLEDSEHPPGGAVDAWPLAVLVFLPVAQRLVALGLHHRAYQAKMRLSEVLDLTDAAELLDGLYIARRKGSKDNIMLWTESTRAAWEEAKATRNAILRKKGIPQQIDPKRRFLVISERTGDRLTASGFGTAKKRVDAMAKAKAERLGIEYAHFTFRDMKKKGISDFQGNDYDKMQASGHRSLDMMKVYNLSKAKVKATTDG